MALYRRILLKISGEALRGKGDILDSDSIKFVIQEIHKSLKAGVSIAIVIGGGNIFRGLSGAASGIERNTGDSVGMLATTINSLILAEYFRAAGIDSAVLSAIEMNRICEYYTPEKGQIYLDRGKVVICAGGTGNPYFTTDTAAALRCAELKCQALFKATKVDGIYEEDPEKNPEAQKIETITHRESLDKGLGIMDPSAFSLCMDNRIPIVVFKLLEHGNLSLSLEGKGRGTTVKPE